MLRRALLCGIKNNSLSFGEHQALRLARFQSNGSIMQEPSPNQSPSGTIDLSIPITGSTRRLVVPQTLSVPPGPIHLLQKRYDCRASFSFLFFSFFFFFKHQKEGKKKDKSASEEKVNLIVLLQIFFSLCATSLPSRYPYSDHGRGPDFADKRGERLEGNVFLLDATALLSHSEQREHSHRPRRPFCRQQ